jgi:dihydrofolate reductase
MVIFGSGRLVSQLAQAGLIDEYQLRVNPVVLGSGKPLFPDLKQRVKLQLLSSRTAPSGVVVLHYQLDNT